jgi:hypothetical protein
MAGDKIACPTNLQNRNRTVEYRSLQSRFGKDSA